MKGSDKLISKMKNQNVKPIPKWRFTLKEWLIWFLLLISVTIGGLAFSVILFAIQQLDFSLVSHMSHSKFEFFLALLPFLWIVLLMIFLILSVISIKKSKRGYKFTPFKMVIINALFSILLGTLFFIGGGAEWLDNAFDVSIEAYESINEKKIKMWNLPDDGRLSGTIEKTGDSTFFLVDFKNKVWEISYLNAFVSPSVFIEEGERIKIVGEKLSNKMFRADEIRPWGGRMGGSKNRKSNKK